MRTMIRPTLIGGSLALIFAASPALCEVSTQTIQSLSAPDTIDTRAGKLESQDGVPTAEAAQKVYDTLDFTNALNVYNNSFRGASALALVKGFEGIGANPGDVVIFSSLLPHATPPNTGDVHRWAYVLEYLPLRAPDRSVLPLHLVVRRDGRTGPVFADLTPTWA